MAKSGKKPVGIGQALTLVDTGLGQKIDRSPDAWTTALLAAIRGVERRIEETRDQGQMQFEGLQGAIQMLATHMVRIESRLEQHVQRSTFERARLREEVLTGAVVERGIRRSSERA